MEEGVKDGGAKERAEMSEETTAPQGKRPGGIRPAPAEQGQSPDGLLSAIRGMFPGKKQDIRSYSPLTLAYIGDAVYDLLIRTVVVERANRPANALHHITVKYVSAGAQAKIVDALFNRLTEEEQAVYRRGKNSKPHTTAKNASIAEYMKATGFEAVIGYLYLKDNMERVLELVKEGILITDSQA